MVLPGLPNKREREAIRRGLQKFTAADVGKMAHAYHAHREMVGEAIQNPYAYNIRKLQELLDAAIRGSCGSESAGNVERNWNPHTVLTGRRRCTVKTVTYRPSIE
jgi:hypothetical protein